MSMSRKHFEEMAEIIKKHNLGREVIEDFSSMCSRHNSLVDRQRFIFACKNK